MSKKGFEKVYSRLAVDMEWLKNELYQQKERNEHSKLLDFIDDCKRGHTCCCDEKTEKMCKDLKEVKGFSFDYLKNDVFWKVESCLDNMPWYLENARERKKKEAKKCSECGELK